MTEPHKSLRRTKETGKPGDTVARQCECGWEMVDTRDSPLWDVWEAKHSGLGHEGRVTPSTWELLRRSVTYRRTESGVSVVLGKAQ